MATHGTVIPGPDMKPEVKENRLYVGNLDLRVREIHIL
jgi:RNA recognition motif-containing protein